MVLGLIVLFLGPAPGGGLQREKGRVNRDVEGRSSFNANSPEYDGQWLLLALRVSQINALRGGQWLRSIVVHHAWILC